MKPEIDSLRQRSSELGAEIVELEARNTDEEF
jgi:hypothetical protein